MSVSLTKFVMATFTSGTLAAGSFGSYCVFKNSDKVKDLFSDIKVGILSFDVNKPEEDKEQWEHLVEKYREEKNEFNKIPEIYLINGDEEAIKQENIETMKQGCWKLFNSSGTEFNALRFKRWCIFKAKAVK